MSSSGSTSSIEWEAGFEELIFPCYSIRVLSVSKEIEICRHKKVLKKFAQSLFPKDFDFNNVDTLCLILNTVKEHGMVGLVNKYQLM